MMDFIFPVTNKLGAAQKVSQVSTVLNWEYWAIE